MPMSITMVSVVDSLHYPPCSPKTRRITFFRMSLLFVVNQTLVLPLFLPSDLEKGLKMDLVRFLSLVGSPFLLGVFPNTKELCYSAVLKNSGELASSAIIGYVFNKGQSSQSVWFSTWFYSWSCSFCELYSTVL